MVIQQLQESRRAVTFYQPLAIPLRVWVKMSHKMIPFFRFLETGLKSDFNKLRMKLSEIGNIQLENLNRKSRQLQRAISRDLRTEDSIYCSEVDAPHFTHCFYPRADCRFAQRQPFASIEVVNLDWCFCGGWTMQESWSWFSVTSSQSLASMFTSASPLCSARVQKAMLISSFEPLAVINPSIRSVHSKRRSLQKWQT